MLTDHDIARWRLRSQRLVAPFAPSVGAVIHHLGAVQAENPGQAAWAVCSRTPAPDAGELQGMLVTGEVIRTHVLRPTWHYVTSQDAGWLLELTASRIRPVILRQLRHDHGLTTQDLDRMSALLLETLTASPDRTRQELASSLQGGGFEPRGAVLMLLLALLELDRLVCSGRPRGGTHTYALFAERVRSPRQLDGPHALAELAVRYFTGHGPATEADLAYWASLTLTDVRHGLGLVRDRLASFQHGGRTFWCAPDTEPPGGPHAPAGHLLQILDELYRGYQQSRMLIDAEGIVPRGREAAVGMALVGGQMVARMRRTLGRRVVFALTPYRGELRPAEHSALEQAAARYGTFLGLDHDITLA